MLTLKQIYALEGKRIPLTQWELRDEWFAELPGALSLAGHTHLETMEADGRLVMTELLRENYEGGRYAALHTLTFDGVPVLIGQSAGRSGRDHQRRFITDKHAFAAMLSYVAKVLQGGHDVEDFVDPDQLLYPETVVCFYGQSFAEQLGFEVETPLKGVEVLPNTHQLMDGLPPSEMMVTVKKGVQDLPEYIRRGEFVMRRFRLFTAEELDVVCPRAREVNEHAGIDRTYQFSPCEPPKDVPVLSV